MKNYSLSIYRISINKRLDKNDRVILSDYDYGNDLLSQLNEFFNTLKIEQFSNESSSIIKDDEEKKISRIFKNQNGLFELHTLSIYISGIIESGEFGTEENIIDSNTGQLKYRKKSIDAQMIPFFFMFNIPENSPYGYMVIERIGNIGIFSTLTKSIQKFLAPLIQDNVVLKIEPFFIQEVMDRNLNVISEAKKVIIKGVRNKDLGIAKITDNLITDDIQADIVYKAPRNGSIQIRSLLDKLKPSKNKKDLYTFPNIEYADIAFELKLGGKTKTISIGNINNLGTNLEITESITIGSNGYPTYESILQEAQKLLSYIKDEKKL